MRITNFKYLVSLGVKSAWRNKLMSFASFCIIMVSLLLVGFSLLTSVNLTKIIGNIEDKNEVVVIIKDGTTEEDMAILNTYILTNKNVAESVFYSKDEAWESMKESMTDAEKDLFQYADTNPLPDSYRIRIKDISKLETTVNELSVLENVESVKAPTDFATVLTSVRNVITAISSTILIALIAVSMVIISNTTRTSVFTRRKEINIMKYVGATNTFIKVPFFIEGMVVGLFAAIVAIILTLVSYNALYNTFGTSIALWSALGMTSLIPLNDIVFQISIAYIAAGVLLGAIGTVISTRKYLKV